MEVGSKAAVYGWMGLHGTNEGKQRLPSFPLLAPNTLEPYKASLSLVLAIREKLTSQIT